MDGIAVRDQHGRRAHARAGSALAAVLAACSLGCSSALEALDPAGPRGLELPPAELTGVQFEGYRGELRDVLVTAAAATVDMGERKARLRQVSIAFSEATRGAIEVTAPAGEFRLDQDDFVLTGGVAGSARAGERFRTDTLRYDSAMQLLASESPVSIDRANLDLRADRMTLELDSRRLRLTGNVQARVVPR